MKSKADMSLNLIIAAIIAVFLLVIIIALVSGALGNQFKFLQRAGYDDVESAVSTCQSKCNDAKSRTEALGASVWDNSAYCTQTFKIDIDGDGEINQDTEILHCWNSPISTNCQYTISETVEKSQEDCAAYA